MPESFKLQVKSKRTDLVRQAIRQVGFDLRKALLWSITILAVTGFGIGIVYWVQPGKKNSPTPCDTKSPLSPLLKGGNQRSAPPESVALPESTADKNEPSVAAPYFTEKMNKEINNLRVEREKGMIEQHYMKETARDVAAKQKRNVSPRDIDEVMADQKELNRMAVDAKTAGTATVKEYALEMKKEELEDEKKFTGRLLLDGLSSPQESPSAPDPPIRQEPTFIEKIWDDIVDAVMDIVRFFLEHKSIGRAFQPCQQGKNALPIFNNWKSGQPDFLVDYFSCFAYYFMDYEHIINQ